MEKEKRTIICVSGGTVNMTELAEQIQKARQENNSEEFEVYFLENGELVGEEKAFSEAIIGNGNFLHDRMKDLLEEMSEFKYPVFLENPLDVEAPPCYEKNSWLKEKRQNQKQKEVRKQITPVPNRIKMLQTVRRKTGKENVA